MAALEQSQFPGWRKRNRLDGFFGNLADWIKVAKRLQFISKKFQAHGPWTAQRKNIQNAAAQRDFSFLIHLRFRFVAGLFQPLDEIERIDAFTSSQAAHSA